jgi:hypothetical protein
MGGGRYCRSGIGFLALGRIFAWPRSLTSHREMEPVLGCDQVIEVFGGLIEVDLPLPIRPSNVLSRVS